MTGATDTRPRRGMAARLTGLAKAVGADPAPLRRGRHLDATYQPDTGVEILLSRDRRKPRVIDVRHGPMSEIERSP